MSDVVGKVIPFRVRKNSSPRKSSIKLVVPPHRRRLNHVPAGYIPEPIHSAYRSGKINDTLFRLIYIMLTSDQDFVITREFLESQFSSKLDVYLAAIKKARIVELEEKVLPGSSRPSNIYHTNHPDLWDLGPILEIPKAGQRTKKAKDPGSTSQVKGACTSQVRGKKKPNDIDCTSQVKGKGFCTSQVSTLRNPSLKPPAAKLLKLDQLHSRLRLRFSKHTPGEHIRGLVDVLVQWETKRLVARGVDERFAKVRGRERVLELINTVPASKLREFEVSTQDDWVKMLESFPAE